MIVAETYLPIVRRGESPHWFVFAGQCAVSEHLGARYWATDLYTLAGKGAAAG